MKYLCFIASSLFFAALAIMTLLNTPSLLACPACEKQQPALTAGITHGVPPTGTWEYVIVGVMTALTLAVAVLSIRSVLLSTRQKEARSEHIKHIILE